MISEQAAGGSGFGIIAGRGRPAGIIPDETAQFLRTATVGALRSRLSLTHALAAEKETRWSIGCFNRPGAKWERRRARRHGGAGYKLTGLLTGRKEKRYSLRRRRSFWTA